MPEVLSQSQIDALLSAINSGEKDLEQKPEQKQDKQYRKYDFYSPKKFTRDRIKMLNGIFESYTRIINSRLNALLRVNCEVSVESIEEQRYYEFSNALTEGDVLSIASVTVQDVPHPDDTVLVYMGTAMSLSMMDRMMGGSGAMDKLPKTDYTYTNLELHLYESIIQDLVSVMGAGWENYIPMHFDYVRTEVNPTLVQLIGLDEIVVIVDMKLQFEEDSGRLSVCLPASMLTNLFAEISRENPGRRVSGEDNSTEIFDELRDSSLEIIAELGSTQLNLSDVYHLSVGDVIDLGYSKDSPVHLEIGGYSWFSGRIGTYKKNMAVKIDEICYQQAEEGSE
ncbi:MAG: flagellar motor switch protein FliM [Oscillospiraceae bacterium]|nr:flagellar motor switch protein FliM [Oscillospiraceae bacterium]